MRALITGIGGFAGSHLADWLVACGDEVTGITRSDRWPEHLSALHGKIEILRGDLVEARAVRQLIADVQPEVVYHLAALASARQAYHEPVRTLSENVAITASVMGACQRCAVPPRVLLVTSSDMYGVPSSPEPLTEDTPFAPPNAYAVSKVCAHYLGRQLHSAHGIEVIEARPFNHIGPRQSEGFVVPDFASQIAAMELGQQDPVLRVGDLSSGRDFSDVRDIVRGYRLLAEQGTPGEAYHLCSERTIAVQSLVDQLVALAKVPVEVEVDPARLRPGPQSVIVGSAAKLRAACGWQAERRAEDCLAEVLDEWRRIARAS
ncbi:MAG: GDP-mannose 4,6-dehydratase [Armatimonadetes bacterium]|nr:GDP-mannose 4,6-dehydratase [Armatimonadota bacterium]